MPQRRGYILVRKVGPTEQEQLAVLRKAGVKPERVGEPLFVDRWSPRRRQNPGDDPLPERTECIERLRRGEVVAVHSPACLGITPADARRAMIRIAEKGCGLYIASEELELEPCECIADWLRMAEKVTPEIKADIAAAARAAARAAGKLGVAQPRFTAADYRKAKPIWFDLSISGDDAAKIAGISKRMLAHKFGPRTAQKGKRR